MPEGEGKPQPQVWTLPNQGIGFSRTLDLHGSEVADQARRSAALLSRARSRRHLSRLGALLLTLGLSTAFSCALAFAYAWSGWLGVATVAGFALSILGAGILDSTRKQTERERYDWQRVQAVRRNATPK